jgi:hypothetical protein
MAEVKRIRTSMDVNADIWRAAKAAAALEGVSLARFVEEAIAGRLGNERGRVQRVVANLSKKGGKL